MTDDWNATETRVAAELRHLAERASVSADAFEQIEGRLLVNLEPERLPRARRARSRPLGNRRRWLVPALGLAAVVALVVAGLATSASNGGSTGSSRQVNVVPADHGGAASLSGEVAYVSAGRLTLVTLGAAGEAITMAATGAANPKWSADGGWLAYQSGPATSPDQLHIVAADGTQDRVVLRGALFAFAWSGAGGAGGAGDAGDLVAASPVDRTGPGGGLVVVGPSTPARAVAAPGEDVFSFHWSTRGTTLAYSVVGQHGSPDQVRIADTASGANYVLADAPPGDGIIIAKWWPDDAGLLWWADPQHSASLEADGLLLQSIRLDSPLPRDLLITAVYLPWLAWSPDGTTLAVVTGGDRFPWNGQSLAFCHPQLDEACQPVPQPAGVVTLDPAWSPDGARLAFVRAPTQFVAGNGITFTTWYETRTLWTAAADGASAAVEEIGAKPGVSSVSWSSDGASLRYATADSVAVIPASPDAATTVLVGGLQGGSGAGPDGYGKTPWGGVPMWRP